MYNIIKNQSDRGRSRNGVVTIGLARIVDCVGQVVEVTGRNSTVSVFVGGHNHDIPVDVVVGVCPQVQEHIQVASEHEGVLFCCVGLHCVKDGIVCYRADPYIERDA